MDESFDRILIVSSRADSLDSRGIRAAVAALAGFGRATAKLADRFPHPLDSLAAIVTQHLTGTTTKSASRWKYRVHQRPGQPPYPAAPEDKTMFSSGKHSQPVPRPDVVPAKRSGGTPPETPGMAA